MEIVGVAKQRITSIKTELGKDVAIEQVNKALVEGFQNALGIELVEDSLSVYELDIARKLAKEKYASEKWNFRATYSSA
jgi:lipoate-protein ligase A